MEHTTLWFIKILSDYVLSWKYWNTWAYIQSKFSLNSLNSKDLTVLYIPLNATWFKGQAVSYILIIELFQALECHNFNIECLQNVWVNEWKIYEGLY